MGIDLRLLPFASEKEDYEWNYSQTVLDLERHYVLWEAIDQIAQEYGRDVPQYFNSFLGHRDNGERGYGLTLKDAYDTPLQSVPARWLKSLADHPEVQDNWQNRAAWAYLEKLPDELQVALYWH